MGAQRPQLRREIIPLGKETIAGFQRHKAQWLAAAIAYFTVFAIAPLIIVIVEIAGVILGQHRSVLDTLYGYLSQTAGKSAADGIRAIVSATFNQKRAGPMAQILSWAFFGVAAIGLFGSLQERSTPCGTSNQRSAASRTWCGSERFRSAGSSASRFSCWRSGPIPSSPLLGTPSPTFFRSSRRSSRSRTSSSHLCYHGAFWIVIQISARVRNCVVRRLAWRRGNGLAFRDRAFFARLVSRSNRNFFDVGAFGALVVFLVG